MKLNFLKLITLALTSGFFINSIPTKAESFKPAYEFLNSDPSNNILIAQSDSPIYRVIKKAIVKKNGYLKLKLVKPVENVSGSVVVNSPNGVTKEYLIENARISKKAITWQGGSENVFLNKTSLRKLLIDYLHQGLHLPSHCWIYGCKYILNLNFQISLNLFLFHS